MNKNDIKFGDMNRLLLGDAPVEFMVEVFIRTVLIYLILMVVLRLLGKRMTSQASILELAVMVTLGAIIALPMQDPKTGLLPGIVILFCVLAFHRLSNRASFKSPKLESVLVGNMVMLVKDGVINISELKKASISHDQLYAHLRQNEIKNLGKVKRLYMEACGLFSVFQYEEPRPGLSILPEKDKKWNGALLTSNELNACRHCGKTEEAGKHTACRHCVDTGSEQAVIC